MPPEDSNHLKNNGFTARTVVIVFLAVAAFYFAGFHGVEYLRVRKGPWTVRFETSTNSPATTPPAIVVNQPHLGIRDVRLVLHGEQSTHPTTTVQFDGLDKDAGFGEVIYTDLTFLPGVVTLNLFGHEIELVPRLLFVDRRAVPWQPGSVIDLWPTNKPTTPLVSPKGNRPGTNPAPNIFPR